MLWRQSCRASTALLLTIPSGTYPVCPPYQPNIPDKVSVNKGGRRLAGGLWDWKSCRELIFDELRYNSNVIRLSNNNLVDTHGLYQLALDLVECPENIAWLDLSFNDIEEVTDDILE